VLFLAVSFAACLVAVSVQNKTGSKTHSKEEHTTPTPTHKHSDGTCRYINNRRQQFPHQKDFNT
jgi:hypothetical protein